MDKYGKQVHIMGFAKALLYVRIAIHVALRYGKRVLLGSLGPIEYLRFLRRGILFLGTVRHSKAIRREGLTKIHLYVPAYPSQAFFHLLDKLLSPEPGPGTVVFSMTRACRYRCPHCYQQRDKGKDLDEDLLIRTARQMQEAGVSLFDIEGGEPLLRLDRLKALMESLDGRSELWINTTGDGSSPEIAKELVALGLRGVMVSIHSPDPEKHDAFTGVDGSFETARRCLREFAEAGAFTAVNCCPGEETTLNGDLVRLLDIGRDLRCAFVQIIHGKASGGWLGKGGEEPGTPAVRKQADLHLIYNGEKRFLEHPSVSAQVFEEAPARFGCTAGGVDRFYLGADGEVQPCEFLNVSFGNVQEEEFPVILKRMRDHFRTPGTSWLCCRHAASIHEAVVENGLTRTPVPWEITRNLVTKWERGEETPLYRKLGIYR